MAVDNLEDDLEDVILPLFFSARGTDVCVDYDFGSAVDAVSLFDHRVAVVAVQGVV